MDIDFSSEKLINIDLAEYRYHSYRLKHHIEKSRGDVLARGDIGYVAEVCRSQIARKLGKIIILRDIADP